MLEAITRVPAYNPDFVETWLRDTMGVTSADKISDILTIYQKWYDRRQHICEAASVIEPKQAHVSLIMDIDTSGWKMMVAVCKTFPQIAVRKQNPYATSFDHYGPMDWGRAILGYTDEYDLSLPSISGNDIYANNWLDAAKTIHKETERGAIKDLIQPIMLQLGDQDAYFAHKAMAVAKSAYWPLRDHACAIERQRVNAALKVFLGHLDQGALQIMHQVRHYDNDIYTWLIGRMTPSAMTYEQKIATNGTIEKRRAVMKALPVISDVISSSEERTWDRFTDAIDQGSNLLDMINTALNDWNDREGPVELTAETLSWLTGKRKPFTIERQKPAQPGLIPPKEKLPLISYLPGLNALPRDWRPKTAGELSTFRLVASLLSTYERATQKSKIELTKEFIEAVRNPDSLPPLFLGYEETPKGQKPVRKKPSKNVYENLDAIGRRLHSNRVGDFEDKVSSQIILPEIFRQAAVMGIDQDYLRSQRDERTDAKLIEIWELDLQPRLFRNLSLIKIASLNMRWHSIRENLERRTDSINDPVTWPALFPPMTLADGVRLECLVDNITLRTEGHRMDHCVGNYAYQCAFAKSHIVSLKAPDGTWQTTMELVEDGEGRELIVRQHYGPSNSLDLDPQALRAEQELLAYLKTAEIDWDAIDVSRAKHAADPNLELKLQIGFDHVDQKTCNDVYDAWRGAMPIMFPDQTLPQYLRRTGLWRGIQRKLRSFNAA